MDTLLDIRTAIQDDLTVGDESTLFSPPLIDRAVNRAYNTVAVLFRWPQLKDAKTTSTQAGVEYYDYPTTWRPDSIWRLEVDGIQYGESLDGSPLGFEDYLSWRNDSANANSAEYKWANQRMRFFMFPVPTSTGSGNISVWGMKNVVALSSDESTTVFSYNSPEVNEAIQLEALAILRSKGEDDNKSQLKSASAKQILSFSWNRLRQEQGKVERNQPMFNVSDMFGPRGTTSIGNF